MPPQTEVALSCRLTSHNHVPEELIESLSDQVVLANSINQSGLKGDMIVRCINPTKQLLELAARLTIGTFTSISQQDTTELGGRLSKVLSSTDGSGVAML